MDELRFRSQQSPRNDSSLLGLVSPPRNGSRVPQPIQSQDARGGLTRRFTTDSARVPTIGSLANQRAGQEVQDYGPSVRIVSFIQPYLLLFANKRLSHPHSNSMNQWLYKSYC